MVFLRKAGELCSPAFLRKSTPSPPKSPTAARALKAERGQGAVPRAHLHRTCSALQAVSPRRAASARPMTRRHRTCGAPWVRA